MRLPSKVFSYQESVLSQFPIILNILKDKQLSISELRSEAIDEIDEINEFLETLDCLYALGVIEYDEKAGALWYVA